MFFPENFQNKKILIFGYGKTGKSVQNYFIKNKIKYTIWDDNKKLKSTLSQARGRRAGVAAGP